MGTAKYRKPDIAEQRIIKSYEEGGRYSYSVYVLQLSSMTEFNNIIINARRFEKEHSVLKSAFAYTGQNGGQYFVTERTGSPIMVYNIDHMERDAGFVYVKNKIEAERFMTYRITSSFLYYIHAVKFSEDNIICIMSECDILREVLGSTSMAQEVLKIDGDLVVMDVLESDEIDIETELKVIEAYEKGLMPLPEIVKGKRYMISEVFPIPEELLNVINSLDKTNKENLKTAIMSIASKILCDTMNEKSMIIGEIHRGNPMYVFPLKYYEKENFADSVTELKNKRAFYDQIRDCRISKLELALNRSVSDFVNITYEFLDDLLWEETESLERGVLYYFKPQKKYNSPLQISCSFLGDSPSFYYDYDKTYLGKYNIEQYNTLLLGYIEEYLKQNGIVAKKKGLSSAEVDNETRIFNAIFKSMRSLSIFEDVNDDKLRELAKGCRIRKYKEQSIIINEGTQVDKLFIVYHGVVAMLGHNPQDNKLDPIEVMNKGKMFGYESFYANPFASYVYGSTLGDTFVIEIPVDLINTVIEDVFSITSVILEEQGKQLKKMRNLYLREML